MEVRFRDLSVSDEALRAELMEAVETVLRHGQVLMGPEVEVLERAVAADCGTAFAVGVASGTDALYMALRGLGIGPGDEVITTPLSWIATLNAIHLVGATGAFVDIRDDLNIDAGLIEAAVTPATRMILPVHFNGRLCDMDRIGAIAEKHGLKVLEDAAQAYGARLGDSPAGSFGDAATFSFNPMKVLPAYGEAGAVVTDNEALYQRLLSLRYLGTVDKEECRWPSFNGKIDTLQAAMLLVSRKYHWKNVERRLHMARRYDGLLSGVVPCPPLENDGRCVFFDYQIVAEDRDRLQAFLAGRGIETKVKHPILMPRQPAYTHLRCPPLPVAERLVSRILCLPIHEKMSDPQITYVADSVRAFFGGAS